jgi:bifunctional non-homologous end joining protein LigD
MTATARIADLSDGRCTLMSRNRNVYRAFKPLCAGIPRVICRDCILDGEIVCLDEQGRPQFYDLLRRRGEPVFVAFDLLSLDGRDLRQEPLIQRKRVLRSIVPKNGPVLYANHLDGRGVELYRRVCQLDIEGIVAKWKHGAYVPGEKQPNDRTLARLVRSPQAIARFSWLKIKNPDYSQMEGRGELLERRAGSGKR